MASRVSVLLIEDNRIEARQTQHWLAAAKDSPFDVECVDHLQAGLACLARGGIDLVLLDLNLPDSRGLETFVKLHEQAPQIPVVVLTGEYDESIGPMAVQKGAQDYLVKQEADAHTLNRVLRHALVRHQVLMQEVRLSQHVKSERIIGFIGAKGGTGTTTTALNVALSLAMQGKPVIFVELRPYFGTLACHLNRIPQNNLRNLLDLPPEQIGPQELDSALCQCQAGLRVLFGPQQAKEYKDIDPKQAEAIVRGLARKAEFVVLDLPNQPSPATQAAVQLCSFVAVVTEREPAAIAAGKATLNQLQSWGVGGDVVGTIIVNRTIYPITMDIAEIQAGMGCPIVGVVPWAATACLRALREGEPLVVAQRDNDAALGLAEIAGKVIDNKLVGINL